MGENKTHILRTETEIEMAEVQNNFKLFPPIA